MSGRRGRRSSRKRRSTVTESALKRPEPPVPAALRFVLEVVAWVAIQRLWGWGGFLVAVLLLALLNAPGDKKVQGIPIPGPFRALLELVVLGAGAFAVADWLGPVAGAGMAGAILLLLLTGRERYRWLLTGAPAAGGNPSRS